MNAANVITISRIVMIPLFMAFASGGSTVSKGVALVIFIAASISDAVDGYVARRYNQVTLFGQFIDPLADKLLVTAALLIFLESGRMPAWAAMVIISREFMVTSLRIIAISQGRVIAAALSGKIKTTVQILGIIVLLLPIGGEFVDIVVCWCIVAVTVWSGVEYIVSNRKLLKDTGN